MAKKSDADTSPVVVVGLGRFGTSVAQSLVHLGHEVLAIDEDMDLVQRWSGELTHVVQADCTDEDALRQVGVDGFDRAIVGIGNDVEASVLTVLTLVELGVKEVWAKAISKKHGKILHSVGAFHVVYPESAMGERVAHMVTGAMIDYIELDDDYAIARTRVPSAAAGMTLAEAALRTKHGVTIVGVKRRGEDFTHALPDTEIHASDELIVSGPTRKVEKFAAMSRQGE